MSLLNNPEFVDDLRRLDLSSREIAGRYGCSYSVVNKYRRNMAAEGEIDLGELRKGPRAVNEVGDIGGEGEYSESADGTRSWTQFHDRPWTRADHEDFLRRQGLDPDDYTFSCGWTSRPGGGFWNKLNNLRKIEQGDLSRTVTMETIEKAISSHTRQPRAVEPKFGPEGSLIVVATDLQIGKVDWHGGTPETIESVLNSFHAAADMAREFNVAEIVIVDAGDIIENEYNTSSQLATNDTSLPWQVGAAMRVMLQGIMILANAADSMKYVAVSSNHGAHRKGMKAPASDVHSDYGLVIADMIGTALKLNHEAFNHVEVITPEPFMESLAFETSGSKIGVVHGHQVSSPDKLGEWWKGQTHGNMPTADARILISGHWHSLRFYQSGDARYVFVGPSSDRGSSWFTNLKGESSQPGMMAFVTADNQWSDLRIL